MSYLLLLCLLQSSPIAHGEYGKNSRPNIIYLLSDNIGYGNLGYIRARNGITIGNNEVVTPRIDNLAKTGVILDRLYAYKFCSPSRCSLLTGRLPIHVNTHNDDQTKPGAGIPLGMSTIAEKLKSVGYATHQVGKWHAGFASPSHLPAGRGFDTSLGYLWAYNGYLHSEAEAHCPQIPGNVTYVNTSDHGRCTDNSTCLRHLSHITDLWDTWGPATSQNRTVFEERVFTEKVVDLINAHATDEEKSETPLFIYYAMHLLHSPLCAPKQYLDRFSFITDSEDRQFVSAMLNYLDDVVGEVQDTLQHTGLWNNTLLIWSSDNGAAIELGTGAKSAFPLRGGYYTNWEGGIRTPGLINGGILPDSTRGTARSGYIHLADWYSTFCYLAGVDPTDSGAAKIGLPPIDSMNMWPMLSGANTTSPRTEWLLTPTTDPIANGGRGGDAAYILGPYKLILNNISQASWEGPTYPNGSSYWDTWTTVEVCTNGSKVGCLFNIIEDETEHKDLALKMPEKVAEIMEKIGLAMKTLFDPDRGASQNQTACEQVVSYSNYWGPWLPNQSISFDAN